MDSLKLSSFYSLRSGSSPCSLLAQAFSSCSTRPRAFCVATSSLGAQNKEASSSQLPTEKSRGEIFLERALAKRRTSNDKPPLPTFAPEKKRTKKKKKKDIVSLSKEPGCYGCGADLQTHEAEAPGYVPLDTYELNYLVQDRA